MNSRRVASFVEAVLSDRRPNPFKADPADADVLRVAIAMRAARPGADGPDEQFVAHLRQELARDVHPPATTPVRPVVTRRARLMLGAAAVVSLLGGTVAATTTVDHALASGVPHAGTGQLLRMGTFRSPDGRAVGQLVAYRGNPSWVFMSIRDPGMTGTVLCRLEADNGQIAASGEMVVHSGKGEWARPLSVDLGRVRGAILSTSSGSTLAVAHFNIA